MDLRAVGAGILWVLGFGGVLAALGHASWWASVYRTGLRAALRRPAFATVTDGSLACVCAGFAVASRDWWEAIVWLVLAVSFAGLGGRAGWQVTRHPAPSASVTAPPSEDSARPDFSSS